MPPKSRVLALAALLAIAPSPLAVAGEWELEIYGGGVLTAGSRGGRVTRPPRGESFETLVPGVSSRRVTSWYFGDGGGLLERRTTRTEPTFLYQYVVSEPALDPVLSSAAVRWPLRSGMGLRVGRRMGRRLTAELDVEYGRHAPKFSDRARDEIEAGRLAFESAWSETLSSLPGSQVTSRATLFEGRGSQLVATGVLNVNVATGDAPKWSRRSPRRRFVSYLTFGAGIDRTGGEEARATLVGRYQFAPPSGEGGGSFEETDTVTIRSRTFRTAVVGVLGMGWKQDLSTRWGLRLGARARLSRNPLRIALDSRPSVTTGGPAAAYVARSKAGAIQFVNDSAGIYEGHRSSLSGPEIEGFETFRGGGILIQVNLTLGVFLRF